MRQVVKRKTTSFTPESTQQPSSMNDKIESKTPNFYQSLAPDVKMRETKLSHNKSQ